MNTLIRNAPSCADDREPDVLTVKEARKRILQRINPLRGPERLPIRSALSRILAEDVISPIDVPGHTNSAMDGFAVRHADLAPDGKVTLRCVGTVMAGQAFGGEVGTGECVRIMTGAPLPAGADTVVMREHVAENGDEITFGAGERLGQNIRQAGEDLAKGSAALSAGKRLTPADLGLLASLGQAEVSVVRRPRVAFFSTGDELRALGEPLSEGEVYDSNRYTLFGMLARAGAELRDLGVVRDDPDALRAAFEDAAAHADVVITSGGVSVGDADYTKQVLGELGEVDFWKIAMKPGRPLTFGRLRDAWFFGLPGNPVAVMVTFYQFVLPALHRLAGETEWQPLRMRARLREPLRTRPGRSEFVRGILEQGADGEIWVSTTGAQGSGILRSMSTGNCFILLDEEQGPLEAGAEVTVQPFAGLI
ncbi:MAG: bifunctional molybdopterin-guanine dinucleotide biosynthesis adaptor protein MobB/molybdopterin molybdotransferase MoeA [Gammaproteobacteria bacterium]|nr:MAG: bifunctional molybdopterin-guanine dinucleotide biosynthesis adaptor protein MobB/molybdopterin molybdotransferase MoeA [Gammaproteobacteria bacterium]